MAAPTGVHVMRNIVFTLETVDYANQVTKARLVPDTPIQTIRTLVPDGVVQDVDSTVWTLELSGVQNWLSGGLADALNDNAGNEVDIVLQPRVGTGQSKVTFVAIAVPVEFGGEQGNFRTFEVELPIVGTPAFSVSA